MDTEATSGDEGEVLNGPCGESPAEADGAANAPRSEPEDIPELELVPFLPGPDEIVPGLPGHEPHEVRARLGDSAPQLHRDPASDDAEQHDVAQPEPELVLAEEVSASAEQSAPVVGDSTEGEQAEVLAARASSWREAFSSSGAASIAAALVLLAFVLASTVVDQPPASPVAEPEHASAPDPKPESGASLPEPSSREAVDAVLADRTTRAELQTLRRAGEQELLDTVRAGSPLKQVTALCLLWERGRRDLARKVARGPLLEAQLQALEAKAQ